MQSSEGTTVFGFDKLDVGARDVERVDVHGSTAPAATATFGASAQPNQFDMIDVNHDGAISREEFDRAVYGPCSSLPAMAVAAGHSTFQTPSLPCIPVGYSQSAVASSLMAVTMPYGGTVLTSAAGGSVAATQHSAASRYGVGAQVEYNSVARGGWLKAVVQGFDEHTGCYILDVHPAAHPDKIRSIVSTSPFGIGGSAGCSANTASGCSASVTGAAHVAIGKEFVDVSPSGSATLDGQYVVTSHSAIPQVLAPSLAAVSYPSGCVADKVQYDTQGFVLSSQQARAFRTDSSAHVGNPAASSFAAASLYNAIAPASLPIVTSIPEPVKGVTFSADQSSILSSSHLMSPAHHAEAPSSFSYSRTHGAELQSANYEAEVRTSQRAFIPPEYEDTCFYVEDVNHPSVRVEPNWQRGRWWLTVPVDLKGLEQSSARGNVGSWDEVHAVDAKLAELEYQGELPPLPAPPHWQQSDSCPIS